MINFIKELPSYLNRKIKNFKLQNVIESEIYKLMIKNEYHMVNWFHSDLIFAHNSFKSG